MEPPNEPPPSYDAVISGGYIDAPASQGTPYPPFVNPPYALEGNQTPYSIELTNQGTPYPPIVNPPYSIELANEGTPYPPIVNPPYAPEGNQQSYGKDLTNQGIPYPSTSPYVGDGNNGASLLTTPAPPAYHATQADNTVSITSNSPQETTANEGNDNTNNNDGDEDENTGGGAFCCFFVFAAIPVAMMIVGLQNRNRCPIDDRIPLYLIASGGTITAASFLIFCAISKKWTLETMMYIIAGMLFIAHFGLQIWGSYLVFRKWNDFNSVKEYYEDSDSDMDLYYCNPTLFLFAFSMLIIYWIVVPCLYYSSKSTS